MIMKGVMRPAASAGSKRVGAKLKCRAQLIWPTGASVASARGDATASRARTAAITSRVRRLVTIVSLRLGGHCFDRRGSGEGQTQTHGDAEGAADAAALGRLAKAGQLHVVEGSFQDQLRVDRDDAAFRSASAQRRFEPPQRVQMAGREGEARAPWLGDEKGGAEGLPRLYLLRPPVGLLAREADAAFQRQRGGIAARLARILMHAG